jgi:glycosyltransferase involved in cell wall biosynthesis
MSAVSVLTIVKDRAGHLRQLIAGLSRSACVPAELVVVDMGTPTLDIPEASFPITVIRLADAGLPLAKARNLAARTASSDVLIFLDVDCIPAQDLLLRLGRAVAAHDALICAEIRYLPAQVDGSVWTVAEMHDAGIAHPARKFPDEGLRIESNPGLFWSLAFGIRRSAFERLGGFDERFSGYGAEDTDFGFRARAAELPLMFLGGAGAFHQHHSVCDPPLQHFDDIVRNAGVFHQIWRIWPMDGWLARFSELGLITLHPDRIERLRSPTAGELAAAERPRDVRF